MIVVNIIGGPCCGKSTTAAGVFSELKKRGYNCELSLEYAKDKVYEDSINILTNQIYVFGNQYHRLWRLQNKVDIVITDAPLLTCIYYNKTKSDYFEDLIVEQYNTFNNITYFLDRKNIHFSEEGRYHSKEQSLQIDAAMKSIMEKHNIEYKTLETINAISKIVEDVENTIKNNDLV